MTTLYHASNQEVKKPKIMNNLRNLDFGPAFYTTPSEEQAMRYAKRVVAKRGGKPVVNVYDFDEEAARGCLRVREFRKANKDWLDFVTNHRKNIYFGEHYDIVIGLVANDDVFKSVEGYYLGTVNAKETLRRLKVRNLYVQYAFSSCEALKYLKFKHAFFV